MPMGNMHDPLGQVELARVDGLVGAPTIRRFLPQNAFPLALDVRTAKPPQPDEAAQDAVEGVAADSCHVVPPALRAGVQSGIVLL